MRGLLNKKEFFLKMKKRIDILVFLVILIATVILRTYNYTEISPDYDEASTVNYELNCTSLNTISNYVNLIPLLQKNKVVNECSGLHSIFPLYYLFMKPFTFIPGGYDSPVFDYIHTYEFLRLISILIGIVTIALLFWFCKKYYGLSIAIIASALYLFHPWAQHHATYIRLYGFWALVSLLSLWYFEFILSKFKSNSIKFRHFLLLAVFLILPITIHAGGVVCSIFLIIFFFSYFYYEQKLFFKFKRTMLLFGFITLAVGSVFFIKLVSFAYGRLNDQFYVGVVKMAESSIQFLFSTMFNFGELYIVVLAVALFLVFFVKLKNPTLRRYLFSLFISVVPLTLASVFFPTMFRPDYLFGLFPYFIISVALSIQYAGKVLCNAQSRQFFSILLVLILILSTLPTLISNVFIDQDRFPYKDAAKYISQVKNAKFYSTNQGHIDIYVNKTKVDHLNVDYEYGRCASRQDEYFLVNVRKGKSTEFFYDYKKLKNAQLIDILGKDRLDLRSSKIYVFYRNCSYFYNR
jgi:hypothetical protein